MHKQAVLFAIALIIVLGILLPAVSDAEVLWDASVVTQYLFRGFQNIGGHPAMQPSATWVIGETGVSATAWFSWALSDRYTTAYWDEVELMTQWSGDVGDGINVTGGLFYLGYYTQDNYPDPYTGTWEIYGGATFTEVPFSPCFMLFWDFNDKGGNGPYIQASGSRRLFEAGGVPIAATASIGLMGQEWPKVINGEDEKGISDINLGVSAPLEYMDYMLTPSFTATYVPMQSVNPNHFVFWGRLSVSGSFGMFTK